MKLHIVSRWIIYKEGEEKRKRILINSPCHCPIGTDHCEPKPIVKTTHA